MKQSQNHQRALHLTADLTDIYGIIVTAAASISIFMCRIFPRLRHESRKLNHSLFKQSTNVDTSALLNKILT